jgi:hypothetical protein
MRIGLIFLLREETKFRKNNMVRIIAAAMIIITMIICNILIKGHIDMHDVLCISMVVVDITLSEH